MILLNIVLEVILNGHRRRKLKVMYQINLKKYENFQRNVQVWMERGTNTITKATAAVILELTLNGH